MSVAHARMVRVARKGAADALALKEWDAYLTHQNTIIEFTRDPDEVLAAYLAKGDVLERKLGLPEKADEHYRKVLKFAPRNGPAMLRLARLEWMKGNLERATRLSQRAEEHAVTPQERRYAALVERLACAGEDLDVEAIVQSVVDDHGDGPELHRFLEACPGDTASAAEAAEAFAVCLLD